MLNSEMAKIAELLPPGFRREYDAHIYYDKQTRSRAETLRAEAKKVFGSETVLVGDLIDPCVGPHTKSMFEMNFLKRDLQKMLLWLEMHRKGLIVLVHEVTGYDLRDHTEGAIWLGRPLELDASKLDPDPM